MIRRRWLAFLAAALAVWLSGCGGASDPLAGTGSREVSQDFAQAVVFATNSVYLEQGSAVLSGDVIANGVASGPTLADSAEVVIGLAVQTPAGSAVKANRLFVKSNAAVASEVWFNELDNNGAINGAEHTPLELPVFADTPVAPAADPDPAQPITVARSATTQLAPGRYGALQVKQNGTVVFSGGDYHFASINGGAGARFAFQAASTVVVAGRLDTDEDTVFGPADGSGLSAADIVVYVHGINGSSGAIGATPKAAQLGLRNTVDANFLVPNGTLWIRQNSDAVGAFLARDVDVGLGVEVALDSAFPIEVTPPEPVSPWPKFMGGPKNTGRGVGGGATNTVRWQYAAPEIHGGAAIGADGTVYVGTWNGKLLAFSGGDGTLQWQLDIGGEIARTPAIGPDGTIYLSTGYLANLQGKCVAIDPVTQDIKWQFDAGLMWSGPAIGADGTIYVGSYDRHVYAINGSDGTQRWAFTTVGTAHGASPAITDDGTLMFHDGTRIYAVDGATGALRWQYNGGISPVAIGDDGTAYAGTGDGRIVALNAASGALLWSYPTGGPINGCPAIGTDGTVYAGSNDGYCYAVNGQTGALRWRFHDGGTKSADPAIAGDGTVYFASTSTNTVFAVDGATGGERWRFATAGNISASLAIGADGTVYFGNFNGDFYALK